MKFIVGFWIGYLKRCEMKQYPSYTDSPEPTEQFFLNYFLLNKWVLWKVWQYWHNATAVLT